ncbi:hypothetical protein RHSIM_Rhsim09G0019500 [Rhododendron simsii]|uniref:Uncharacterized protein n=1 Tax=Rhododendron simsii TaxID=118357 RepID=A0A834LBX7_RHOSS|nr:hypothetical protein RHSIM_Rhsim09G0019500 [Rhododendron simsii]
MLTAFIIAGLGLSFLALGFSDSAEVMLSLMALTVVDASVLLPMISSVFAFAVDRFGVMLLHLLGDGACCMWESGTAFSISDPSSIGFDEAYLTNSFQNIICLCNPIPFGKKTDVLVSFLQGIDIVFLFHAIQGGIPKRSELIFHLTHGYLKAMPFDFPRGIMRFKWLKFKVMYSGDVIRQLQNDGPTKRDVSYVANASSAVDKSSEAVAKKFYVLTCQGTIVEILMVPMRLGLCYVIEKNCAGSISIKVAKSALRNMLPFLLYKKIHCSYIEA